MVICILEINASKLHYIHECLLNILSKKYLAKGEIELKIYLYSESRKPSPMLALSMGFILSIQFKILENCVGNSVNVPVE